MKIRGAYEEALQDALSSQADNIHMKAQLAVLHQRKVAPSPSTAALQRAMLHYSMCTVGAVAWQLAGSGMRSFLQHLKFR